MDFEFGYEYTFTRDDEDVFVGKLGTKPKSDSGGEKYLEGKATYPQGDGTLYKTDECLFQYRIDDEHWKLTETRDIYEHERRNAAHIHRWMNKDQVECYLMLCDLMYGAHHVFGKITNGGRNDGIIICMYQNDVATYDYNLLTRAVVLAHDRCIRFSIMPASGDMLRFGFHKRDRAGEMNQRHPTIEDHIEIIRNGQ